jgi:hypothetical protein
MPSSAPVFLIFGYLHPIPRDIQKAFPKYCQPYLGDFWESIEQYLKIDVVDERQRRQHECFGYKFTSAVHRVSKGDKVQGESCRLFVPAVALFHSTVFLGVHALPVPFTKIRRSTHHQARPIITHANSKHQVCDFKTVLKVLILGFIAHSDVDNVDYQQLFPKS